MKIEAVVVVGHGSRKKESNQRFESLVSDYQVSRPDLKVTHAYIELAKPDLLTAFTQAAEGVDSVMVVPMQLFHAGHIKKDIPHALDEARRACPDTSFHVSDAIGSHPKLVELAYKRVQETKLCRAHSENELSVLMVGRGASDPSANSEFYRVVRLLDEAAQFQWVQPSFLALAEPSMDKCLDMLKQLGHKKIIVSPYLLLTGVLHKRIIERIDLFNDEEAGFTAEVASTLESDPLLFEVFNQRIEEAISGKQPLPCDTCEYRLKANG